MNSIHAILLNVQIAKGKPEIHASMVDLNKN